MARKCIDLTGQKFGRLTVIERAERPAHVKSKDAYWLCKCECGNEKIVKASSLKSGVTTSCGCFLKELRPELGKKSAKDLTGQKFGSLTVIEKSDKRDKTGCVCWVCKCECGEVILVRGSSLTRGHTTSCGCFQKNKVRKIGKQKIGEKNPMYGRTGEKHHNYKGGISIISDHLRSLPVVIQWKNDTFIRENYTCQVTGKKGGNFAIHHLKGFNSIVKEAHDLYNIQVKSQVKDYSNEELQLLEDYITSYHTDTTNAVLLSEEVHDSFHHEYGKGDNTPEQFEEFKTRYLAGEFKEIFK